MDSEIRRDRCGVCGGDSSTCKFVRKKWEEKCPGFGKLSDNINRFLLRLKLISWSLKYFNRHKSAQENNAKKFVRDISIKMQEHSQFQGVQILIFFPYILH